MVASWETVLHHFERADLSARLLAAAPPGTGSAIAVLTDREEGEFFALRPDPEQDAVALDASARRRHLLLLIREPAHSRRLLLGHDERHLFVARLPVEARVSRLAGAFDALKPAEVIEAEAAGRHPVRQGEWFFVPTPAFQPGPGKIVHRKAPLQPHSRFDMYVRDHLADELVRVPPEGVDATHHSLLIYVRGAVRHVEHRTLRLAGWHQVFRNREAGWAPTFTMPGTRPVVD
jgi:hypothetical protein